jgi:hypothetical protein
MMLDLGCGFFAGREQVTSFPNASPKSWKSQYTIGVNTWKEALQMALTASCFQQL